MPAGHAENWDPPWEVMYITYLPPHAHNVSLVTRWKEISPSNQTEPEDSIRTKDLEMSEKSGFYESSN
jgi:hypothetical protein